MKKPASFEDMEAMVLRRATFADSDKVRYRVYRSEGDFVAVIAESALMAMKTSGIMNPHRIVRDLPSENITIEAQRMSKVSDAPPVMMSLEPNRPDNKRLSAEMPTAPPVPLDSQFVAMQIKDFQKKKKQMAWARVLTPEMVEQVQAAAKQEPAPPAPPVAAPLPAASMPDPDPVMEALPEPQPEPAAQAAPAPMGDPDVLSEEEVQKLLNG